MNIPLYINGLGYITGQGTHDREYFFEEIIPWKQNPLPAITPEYKDLIPPIQLRRMNKSMRMALYTSLQALDQSNYEDVDAIITATGQGCLTDSEKFVESLLEDEKQLLNPTPFIQSTHNMAAATIALALNCKGYNMTYVNGPHSLESALLDAMFYLREHPSHRLLVGGVDELGIRSQQFWTLAGFLNTTNPEIPTKPNSFAGEIASEGAAFFAVSSEPSPQTLARIQAVNFQLSVGEPRDFVQKFLEEYQLKPEDIDAVVLGANGDNRYDHHYLNIASEIFPSNTIVGFKHLVGENDTVIGAAIAIATQILQRQQIPTALLLPIGTQLSPDKIENILIYNQKAGQHHSLILLNRPFLS